MTAREFCNGDTARLEQELYIGFLKTRITFDSIGGTSLEDLVARLFLSNKNGITRKLGRMLYMKTYKLFVNTYTVERKMYYECI